MTILILWGLVIPKGHIKVGKFWLWYWFVVNPDLLSILFLGKILNLNMREGKCIRKCQLQNGWPFCSGVGVFILFKIHGLYLAVHYRYGLSFLSCGLENSNLSITSKLPVLYIKTHRHDFSSAYCSKLRGLYRKVGQETCTYIGLLVYGSDIKPWEFL